MKKIFQAQKAVSVIYIILAIVSLVYALSFMTEFSDLFGLRLQQNSKIANFHDVILQSFNRQILIWALAGVAVILIAFTLEIFTKVPDRFALVVMILLLAVCCYGAYYGLLNIPAIQTYYQGLDMQYFPLEGGVEYEFKFTTFRLGMALYATQIVVCVGYIVTLLMSHITYVKNRKRGAQK